MYIRSTDKFFFPPHCHVTGQWLQNHLRKPLAISFTHTKLTMDRWQGRVAVITGASAGVGAAVCKLLSQNGMKVVGCARRVEKIEALKAECPNLHAYKVS